MILINLFVCLLYSIFFTPVVCYFLLSFFCTRCKIKSIAHAINKILKKCACLPSLLPSPQASTALFKQVQSGWSLPLWVLQHGLPVVPLHVTLVQCESNSWLNTLDVTTHQSSQAFCSLWFWTAVGRQLNQRPISLFLGSEEKKKHLSSGESIRFLFLKARQ